MRVIPLLLLLGIGCGKPPLRVVAEAGAVHVDVQTLGEYKTTIQRARVACGGRVVWEATGAVPHPQIHQIRLVAGDNACFPEDLTPSDYRVVTPAPCERFRLPRGEPCLVEVWGGESGWSRASAEFRL